MLWLRWIIGEVFWPLKDPIMLYSDSQSAITLTKDGSYYAQTKHIDIRYHFIRFIIQNGSINLIYCPTENMTADILMKALLNSKAKHFARSLRLLPTWGGVLIEWHMKCWMNNILHSQDCVYLLYNKASCHNLLVLTANYSVVQQGWQTMTSYYYIMDSMLMHTLHLTPICSICIMNTTLTISSTNR